MIEPTASTIAEILHEQARARPAASAILAPGRAALTFAGLWQQVSELATALQSLGVTPSTRVAMVLPNGPEMAVVFLGTSMCSTCAPLNPACPAAELRLYLQDLGVQVVMVRAGEAGPAGAVVGDDGGDPPVGAFETHEVGEVDLAGDGRGDLGGGADRGGEPGGVDRHCRAGAGPGSASSPGPRA